VIPWAKWERLGKMKDVWLLTSKEPIPLGTSQDIAEGEKYTYEEKTGKNGSAPVPLSLV